jgi:hypothetical protein
MSCNAGSELGAGRLCGELPLVTAYVAAVLAIGVVER